MSSNKLRDRMAGNLDRSQAESGERVANIADRLARADAIEGQQPSSAPEQPAPTVAQPAPDLPPAQAASAQAASAPKPPTQPAPPKAPAPREQAQEWPWRALTIRPDKREPFPLDLPEEVLAMLRFLADEEEGAIRSMAGWINGQLAPAVQETLKRHLIADHGMTEKQAETATAFRGRKIKGRKAKD